jgi:hypothetical protein
MAISIDNSGSLQNKVFPVRGKYGNLPLEFSSTDHINIAGAKTVIELAFSSIPDREAYFSNLSQNYYFFKDYTISKSDVGTASGVAYILLVAKQEGSNWNNPNLPSGSYTTTILTTGVDEVYKTDYQLYIVAFDENDNPLFTKLYPYVSLTAIANWKIHLAENLASLVYTDIPNVSAASLTAVLQAITSIKIKYGEAYIDPAMNNGELFFYSSLEETIKIANFKPSINGEIDDKYFVDIGFEFLTLWDRSKSYLIPCDGTHFLYFYLNSDAPHLEIKTITYFNDGTSNTFSQNLTNIAKGIHYFPAGPNNHTDLNGLSNIKSYSIQVIFEDNDQVEHDSEVFNFKVQENRNAYEILFLNQLGAFDRLGFDNIDMEDLKLIHTQYLSQPLTSQTHKGGVAISNIETQTRFRAIYQGGFNTPAFRTWLKDFLASEEKYLLRNGDLYRISGEKQEHLIQELDNKVILEFPFNTNHPID